MLNGLPKIFENNIQLQRGRFIFVGTDENRLGWAAVLAAPQQARTHRAADQPIKLRIQVRLFPYSFARVPVSVDGVPVPGIVLTCNHNHHQMDSFRHGFTNPFRDVVKTMHIRTTDQREYLTGITLLFIVVSLWTLSNFIIQVCTQSTL